ncbi:MAG: REP-associated tyrosine transposase [Terriglobia bacterium]
MERYRIHADAAVYFLTYSIVEWLPVFVSEESCKIVTDSLSFCHDAKRLRVNAYVVMPTHLHLIVFDADWDVERLRRTLADFRKFTGRRLSDYCAGHAPRCFQETLQAQAVADRERRFWQPSRHAEAIREERFWRQKIEYLHNNPCRKGLVCSPERWRFSSAAWYISGGIHSVDAPVTPIAW